MNRLPLLRQLSRLLGVAGLSLTAGLFGAGLQHGIAAHAASTKPAASPARPPAGPPLTGTIGAPPGAAAPGLAPVNGTIASTSKGSVKVKTAQGMKTVTVTSPTQFIVKGKPASSRPALRAGEKVQIMAARVKGMLQARVVMITSPL